MQYLPNILSVMRMLLVVPVVYCLLNGFFWQALAIFAIAGLSDGLDGFLARRFHWTSWLGAMLDPLADKLLLVATFLSLGWLAHFPAWFVGVVVGRDLVILSGAISYRVFIGKFNAAPHWTSKICTFFQITLAIVEVFQLAYRPFYPWISQSLLWLVVVLTVLSGAQYVVVWAMKAKRREVVS